MEIRRMYEAISIVDDSQDEEVTLFFTDSQFNIVPRIGETILINDRMYIVREIGHTYEEFTNNKYHHIWVYVNPKEVTE